MDLEVAPEAFCVFQVVNACPIGILTHELLVGMGRLKDGDLARDPGQRESKSSSACADIKDAGVFVHKALQPVEFDQKLLVFDEGVEVQDCARYIFLFPILPAGIVYKIDPLQLGPILPPLVVA
jgi:hypothetical protein